MIDFQKDFLQERIQIRPASDSASALALNCRIFRGSKQPFLLVHGLASNSRTWDSVARYLAVEDHTVITVDQRGHGLSDKPDDGYDFASVAEDLMLLIQELALEKPILVGQSWGGNVALAVGAAYPDLLGGLSFVDGGYLDLQSRPNATWERISQELRPPNLLGTAHALMKERFRSYHPEWDEVGIEGSLANFETLVDGTIRPWLTLERHMMILRAMWEQRPVELYPKVAVPVLIAAAQDGGNASRTESKRRQIEVATSGLANSHLEWFEQTDHDIHVHRPLRLAQLFLDKFNGGFWL